MTWVTVKQRCLNKISPHYTRYGATGITIHKKWATDFCSFYAAVGDPPTDKHQIDRIDTTKGYVPGNIRWVDAAAQNRNRRSTYRWHIKGSSFETMQEAADHFGVAIGTVWRWVNGAVDKRRSPFTKKQKREDCYAVPRY
jgi:hypothetical protein